MKKVAIAVVAALMAGLLIFQYMEKNKKVPVQPAQAGQPQDSGVSLPGDYQKNDLPVVPASAQPQSSLQAPTDTVSSEVGKAMGCKKSVKDIISEYGKIWARKGVKNEKVAIKYFFSQNESDTIEDLLGRYYACRSVASGKEQCGALPQGEKYRCARDICHYNYHNTVFQGFMAGRNREEASCREVYSSEKLKGGPVSPSDFCQAAAGGMDKICDSAKNKLPADKRTGCYRIFPRNEGDCDNFKECLDGLYFYRGFKENNPSLCPDPYTDFCVASVTRKDSSCDNLKEKLLISYCDFSKRVERQQSLEDENRKIDEDINKNIRSAKTKKGGN